MCVGEHADTGYTVMHESSRIASRRLLSARNGTFATALTPALHLAEMITFPVVPLINSSAFVTTAVKVSDDLLGILPLAIERVTICKGTFARMDSYINICQQDYKNLEPSCVSDSAFASFGVWNNFGTETSGCHVASPDSLCVSVPKLFQRTPNDANAESETHEGSRFL